MRTLSVFLLIPLLAGQGIWFRHTHAGSGVSESFAHGVRPHFHVHGTHGGHHQHSGRHVASHSHDDESPIDQSADDSNSPRVSAADDHDADAVYVSAVDALAEKSESHSQSAHREFARAISVAVLSLVAPAGSADAIAARPSTGGHCAHCPVYLSTLTLRL
jgi:hypothetical protein